MLPRMLYCQRCGAGNSDDARFCNQCGGKIAQVGEPGGPITASAEIPPTGAMVPADRQREPEPRREPTPSPEPRPFPGSTEPSQGFDVSTMSLSAMGVRSRGKAWAFLLGIVALLVGAGAGGKLLVIHASNDSAEPLAQNDTNVLEPTAPEEVEIGDAIPEGAEPPGVDFVPGSPRPTETARAGTSATSRTHRTSGSSGSSAHGTSHGSSAGSASGSGSSGSGSSGSGSSGSGSHESGSSSGSNGGASSGSSSSNGGASGGSSSEPDWEAMAEEDTEMDEYASRVRQVVRAYYVRRAQSCFEHETRNDESVRGTVVIGFDIQADGNIDHAEVARNTTGRDTLGRCLASQVNGWRLPPPPEAPLAMQMPFSR
jgi:hypothetical protein